MFLNLLPFMGSYDSAEGDNENKSTQAPKKIMILGDSLIKNLCDKHGLLRQIKRLVGTHHLEFNNRTVDEQFIADMIELLPALLSNAESKPDIMILCWHSDVIKAQQQLLLQKNPKTTADELLQLKTVFKNDLKILVQMIHDAGVYLIVVGPGLAEKSRPFHRLYCCCCCNSYQKEIILLYDSYRDDIDRITKALDGEYIDIRSLASTQFVLSFHRTNDSRRMSRLMADVLAESIKKWLKMQPNQLLYFGKISPRK